MKISVRLPTRAITVLVAILIMRIAPNLAPEICYRVLQAIQLVAQHIEFVPAKGHVIATWTAELTIILSHNGGLLVAIEVLPLVGRMIRTQLGMIPIATRLAWSRKVAPSQDQWTAHRCQSTMIQGFATHLTFRWRHG